MSSSIIICVILVSMLYGSYPGNHRISWQDHYINAKIPALDGLDSSVVILGGNRPSSFLIPGFPSTTRFIRLHSNMHHYLSPASNFRKRTLKLVKTHKDNFYLISWPKFISTEQKLLDLFALEIDTSGTWLIPNPHEPNLTFWRVTRK